MPKEPVMEMGQSKDVSTKESCIPNNKPQEHLAQKAVYEAFTIAMLKDRSCALEQFRGQ